MKALTAREAKKWCSQDAKGLHFGDLDSLRYRPSKEHAFFIAAPEEHRRINFLAGQIIAFRDGRSFSGGLLWLRRWDNASLVWPGWLILESIRRAHGDERSLEVAPAQLFREDELVALHAWLIQVIAFGWVADYVPSFGDFFVRFKDNRKIRFTAASAVDLKELRTLFKEWNPTDKDPMVEKMRALAHERKSAGRRSAR
jgi:hypothetical protein